MMSTVTTGSGVVQARDGPTRMLEVAAKQHLRRIRAVGKELADSHQPEHGAPARDSDHDEINCSRT